MHNPLSECTQGPVQKVRHQYFIAPHFPDTKHSTVVRRSQQKLDISCSFFGGGGRFLSLSATKRGRHSEVHMEVQSRDRRTGAHNFTCLLNALHDTQLYSTSALIVATFDRAETGEGQWTGTPALKCEANSIGCNHLKGRDSDRRASGLRVGLTRERCSSSKLHSATCERLQNLWCYFQKYLLTVAMQSTQTC